MARSADGGARPTQMPRRSPALVLVLGLLPVLGAAAGHGPQDNHNTTLLNKDTFDKYLAEQAEKGRLSLIMFHVNWCKVCVRTFPKFANASDIVVEKGYAMDFAHVDCTDEKSLCTRFEVKGYPTIKLFKSKAGAEPVAYKGGRSEVGFAKYAERMTQPPVQKLETGDLPKVFHTEALAPFVAAAAPGDNGLLPQGLLETAERWMDRHIFTAAAKLQDLLPEGVAVPMGTIPQGATLAVLSAAAQQWSGHDKSADSAPALEFFHGSLEDGKAVNAWVEKHRFPGIWGLDEGNFFEFTHASRRAVLIAVNPANITQKDEALIREVHRKLKDDFIFGIVDGVAWSEELVDFHIFKQDLPRILVAEDDFEAWVEDIEELRFENLEEDLRKVLHGSGGVPLLRQGHGFLQKVLYYKRESWRLALQAYAFGRTGPAQFAAVGVAALAALLMVFATFWCCVACCRALLSEDDEYRSPPPPRQPIRAKRD